MNSQDFNPQGDGNSKPDPTLPRHWSKGKAVLGVESEGRLRNEPNKFFVLSLRASRKWSRTRADATATGLGTKVSGGSHRQGGRI